jgi:hypothetical protein
MEKIIISIVQATCGVEGCENFGHVIEVTMVPDAVVVCGPCGIQILDIEEAQAIIGAN